MTEADWWAATQFDDAMYSTALASVGWSFRKETLFSIACCRRVLHLLDDVEAGRLLIDFEAAALSLVGAVATDHSRRLSDYVINAIGEQGGAALQVVCALGSTANGYISEVAEHCAFAVDCARNGIFEPTGGDPGERRAQADLIRDIVGSPFRDVAVAPAWLTSDVMLLARGIYEEKAFDRMPILADALQDAGCDNDEILNHCRAEKWEHIRGCWVIDLLLGKPWREERPAPG